MTETFPYEEYRKTEAWRKIERALNALIENNDIVINTAQEYVVGYLTQELMDKAPDEHYLQTSD